MTYEAAKREIARFVKMNKKHVKNKDTGEICVISDAIIKLIPPGGENDLYVYLTIKNLQGRIVNEIVSSGFDLMYHE